MTRSDLTDISFVLDRSGSMGRVRDRTIAGFNQFLAEQSEAAGEARLTLVQFNHHYEPMYKRVPLQEARPLDGDIYQPNGRTALLDAIGWTIDASGERLAAMPEDQRPGQVLFVILTDGLENSSHHYTPQQIFERIEHQQHVYQWQFVYLGANQNAIATAAGLGIAAESAMTWEASDRGSKASMRSLNNATKRYRKRGMPMQEGDYFTDEERRDSAGSQR